MLFRILSATMIIPYLLVISMFPLFSLCAGTTGESLFGFAARAGIGKHVLNKTTAQVSTTTGVGDTVTLWQDGGKEYRSNDNFVFDAVSCAKQKGRSEVKFRKSDAEWGSLYVVYSVERVDIVKRNMLCIQGVLASCAILFAAITLVPPAVYTIRRVPNWGRVLSLVGCGLSGLSLNATHRGYTRMCYRLKPLNASHEPLGVTHDWEWRALQYLHGVTAGSKDTQWYFFDRQKS